MHDTPTGKQIDCCQHKPKHATHMQNTQKANKYKKETWKLHGYTFIQNMYNLQLRCKIGKSYKNTMGMHMKNTKDTLLLFLHTKYKFSLFSEHFLIGETQNSAHTPKNIMLLK